MDDLQQEIERMSVGTLKAAYCEAYGSEVPAFFEKAELQAEVLRARRRFQAAGSPSAEPAGAPSPPQDVTAASENTMQTDGTHGSEIEVERVQLASNHYNVLNVKEDAAGSTIKKAYRKLVLKVHPDKAPPDDKNAYTAAFQKVGEAYETLSDASARADYDRQLSTDTAAILTESEQLERVAMLFSEDSDKALDEAFQTMKRMLRKNPACLAKFKPDWLERDFAQLAPFTRNAPLQLTAVELTTQIAFSICVDSTARLPSNLADGLCHILAIAGESRVNEALRALDAMAKVPRLWDASLFLQIISAVLACCERINPSSAWAPYDTLARLVQAGIGSDSGLLSEQNRKQVVENILVPVLIARLTLTQQTTMVSSSEDNSWPAMLTPLCLVLDISLSALRPSSEAFASLTIRVFQPLQMVIRGFNILSTPSGGRQQPLAGALRSALETAKVVLDILTMLLEKNDDDNQSAQRLPAAFYPDLDALLCAVCQADDEEGNELIQSACLLLKQMSRSPKDFGPYCHTACQRLEAIMLARQPPSEVHSPVLDVFFSFALQMGESFEPLVAPVLVILRRASQLTHKHLESNTAYSLGLLRSIHYTMVGLLQGAREGATSLNKGLLNKDFLGLVCDYFDFCSKLNQLCPSTTPHDRAEAVQNARELLGYVTDDMCQQLIDHITWQSSPQAKSIQALLDDDAFDAATLKYFADSLSLSSKYRSNVLSKLPVDPPVYRQFATERGTWRRARRPEPTSAGFRNAQGTRHPNPSFTPAEENEICCTWKEKFYYQSISAMYFYRDQSFEELRFADYLNAADDSD